MDRAGFSGVNMRLRMCTMPAAVPPCCAGVALLSRAVLQLPHWRSCHVRVVKGACFQRRRRLNPDPPVPATHKKHTTISAQDSTAVRKLPPPPPLKVQVKVQVTTSHSVPLCQLMALNGYRPSSHASGKRHTYRSCAPALVHS